MSETVLRDKSRPEDVAAQLRSGTYHNAAHYVLQQAADMTALRARLAEVEAELAACQEQNDDYRKHIVPESNRILARVRAEAVRKAVERMDLAAAERFYSVYHDVHNPGLGHLRRGILAALLPHDPEAR